MRIERETSRGSGRLLAAAGVALALCANAAWATRARGQPVTYAELLARPRPAATKRISYGPETGQFGEIWRPEAKGRRPVVVLIHGGCWLDSLPGLELMDYAADDLSRRGLAVWNVEYRRLGAPGGGYPGTFGDVGMAVDLLKTLAKPYDLDLRHVVLVGHSAGGQLALWAAARRRLPASSPLYSARPLPVAGVVSLAGIDDLQTRRVGPEACGGSATIDQLVGAGHRSPGAVFADTSPAALVPIGVPQSVISGAVDPIVPPVFGMDYAAKAAAAGDKVQTLEIAGAGHFELIDPGSEAWRAIEPIIEGMAR